MVYPWKKSSVGPHSPPPEDSEHKYLCLTVPMSRLWGWPRGSLADQLRHGDRGVEHEVDRLPPSF